MSEPLDLEPIKARLSEPTGVSWVSCRVDIHALVAEVERLREIIDQDEVMRTVLGW